MSNPDCVFTYKCRYCGATFKDEVTSEALATKTLIRICSNTSFVVGGVNEKNIHYAEDHIGLADMIGCEIAKEHGYCDTCKHNGGYPKYETCQGCLNYDKYEKGDTDQWHTEVGEETARSTTQRKLRLTDTLSIANTKLTDTWNSNCSKEQGR